MPKKGHFSSYSPVNSKLETPVVRSIQRLLLPCLLLVACALLPAAASAETGPVNTTPPGVSGLASVGSTLTATPGVWTGATNVETYWVICETATFSPAPDNCPEPDTSDATTYVVPPEAAGKYVIYLEVGLDGDSSPVFAPANTIGPIFDPNHPFGLYWEAKPNWWEPVGEGPFNFDVDAESADIGDLTLTCSMDGEPLSPPCATSNTFADLQDGRHTFSVTATDGTNSETIDYTWMINDVTTRFTQTPDSISSDNEAEFEWDIGTDYSTPWTECKLDDAPWAICPEGDDTYIDLYDLSNGQHTFSIRGIADDGDEVQDPETSYTWTVDTVEPDVTTNLPDVIGTDSFSVQLTPSEPMRELLCVLDDDDYPSNCMSGMNLTGLTDGEHTLFVFGRDLAGNTFEDEVDFYVDLGATVAIFTQKPPHNTMSTDATIAWVGSNPGATFECRLNEPFWHACTSPLSLTGLGSSNEGDSETYNLYVRATKDGRTQLMPSRAHWHVNSSAFYLYFNDNPPPATSSTNAEFEIDADNVPVDSLTLTCKLDDGDFESCGKNVNFESLSLGTHTFAVHATDGSQSEDMTYQWTVTDGVTPTLYWTSTPGEKSTYPDAYFAWASDAPTGTVLCNLDGGGAAPCDSFVANPGNHQLTGLADGEHTFSVMAVADLGPAASNTLAFTWTIDTTPPTISLGGSTNPTVTELPARVPLSSDEPLSDVECLFADADPEPGAAPDDEEWYECSLDDLASYIPNGVHQVTVRGRDAAGNESNELVVNFTVNVPTGAAPSTPAPPTPPVKTAVSKPSFYKHRKFRTPWVCADATCKVTAKIKVGKHTLRLKSKTVPRGHGPVTFNLGKKQKAWMVNNYDRSGSRKATFVITIKGASGSSTTSYKFKF